MANSLVQFRTDDTSRIKAANICERLGIIMKFYAVVTEERKTEDAYLVTGNLKHFPRRTFIVTPREMLAIVLDSAA